MVPRGMYAGGMQRNDMEVYGGKVDDKACGIQCLVRGWSADVRQGHAGWLVCRGPAQPKGPAAERPAEDTSRHAASSILSLTSTPTALSPPLHTLFPRPASFAFAVLDCPVEIMVSSADWNTETEAPLTSRPNRLSIASGERRGLAQPPPKASD